MRDRLQVRWKLADADRDGWREIALVEADRVHREGPVPVVNVEALRGVFIVENVVLAGVDRQPARPRSKSRHTGFHHGILQERNLASTPEITSHARNIGPSESVWRHPPSADSVRTAVEVGAPVGVAERLVLRSLPGRVRSCPRTRGLAVTLQVREVAGCLHG